ncbi:uncharacterized protein FOMMEDRAFT_21363 [Fomitiporia mediterranea MF3/22]|uniref:uncharacterized protein n=1 Tax=Fomitiporia mediterranea (strain MF3/22) TaxID=694068 RepID=UPI00044096C6|nr:uncharacterized protein FOMMEDRAFT_21363 [Fomitiporia mediterranea MF3/22]EJD00896.1 hypothetical protein FOMMEDRAFT_21363 [Fomitiporia mediterranea MF3/22]
MTSPLPNNLHAEVALDRGRFSHDGPERSGARSITQARTTAADPHVRVQSLHGVIIEHGHFMPDEKYGVIEEEPEEKVLSGAELAAALDREEDNEEEDIGTQRAVMHEAQWYEERSPKSAASFSAMQSQQPQPQHRSFAPRQSSLENSSPQRQAQPQAQFHAYPRSILQNRTETLSPPPRSSSCSVPSSAPSHQQAFPDRPRFTLTDDGPISAPSSPGGHQHPGIRRTVSDTHPNTQSEPSSPGLGVTPPLRRGAKSQPGTPKYATFEDMGIRGKGMAQAQAEKDAKDCVIM